jgi:glucose-1-phosphate cytidylyltransferase
VNLSDDQGLPVVILAGGQGTRMRADTETKKELVEVGGRPILWHVMKIFAAFGHTHFILALGYQAEAVKRYFIEFEPMQRDFTIRLGNSAEMMFHGDHTAENWRVSLADTGLFTATGSRVRRILHHVDADTFFLTYGDGVGNVNLKDLVAFHRSHGRLGTVTGVQARWQYGIIHADEGGQVTGFEEKPLLDYWINGGFMVFDRGVSEYLGDSDDVGLEQQVLPHLARDGQLMIYRHAGFWRSMDTFKEAQLLNELWAREQPWKVW